MRLKFVSGENTLLMGDGADALITEINGIGLPEKKYQTQKYVGFSGQVTLSSYVLPREIEIKGDINLKGGMSPKKYHTFFFESGTLYILSGESKKKIEYNPVSFKTGNKNGDFVTFSLKIICDFPYFSDSISISHDIYKRVDKIEGSFTLPTVFTERLTKKDIYNKGQVVCEPVIKVECVAQGVYSGGIIISNGEKVLKLNTCLALGEIITLDIKNRKISSNKRPNGFGILDENCTLSDFVLETGINNVSVSDYNDGEIVMVNISFDNLYAEAM